MIQLLFTLTFVEIIVILILLFRTPLRKVEIMVLDRMKQGRGPVMAKTVAATLSAVLFSSLYSISKIQRRSVDAGAVNPTDQVLLANHLLEASLMGFSLFLALMIDRLHYYIKEIYLLRNSLSGISRPMEDYDSMKTGGADATKSSGNEKISATTTIKQPESRSIAVERAKGQG
ncbi:hypothetical protein RJ640_004722 [Escallonia rubra]|uniref:Endoplasmic reticulum transmembrane protein n=1 Tax=Escallonia rubra TaxID=112253 RepID=A0AA88R609_9ASTE|nr:hypothetical protein RJ640_004722 [Escallonia rubra]